MNEKEFAYWLQGFVELTDSVSITEVQWKMIKEHLSLVFNKITPALQDTVLMPQPGFTTLPFKPGLITC